MATITLEVPDELAAQLEAWADDLPNLLSAIVNEGGLEGPPAVWQDHAAWQEALDFLASAPDVQAMIDYKLPDDLQERLEGLLDANAEGNLRPQEELELDGFIQIIRFFNLLKANLRATLS